jgi:hypothetical protein
MKGRVNSEMGYIVEHLLVRPSSPFWYSMELGLFRTCIHPPIGRYC